MINPYVDSPHADAELPAEGEVVAGAQAEPHGRPRGRESGPRREEPPGWVRATPHGEARDTRCWAQKREPGGIGSLEYREKVRNGSV